MNNFIKNLGLTYLTVNSCNGQHNILESLFLKFSFYCNELE